MLEIPNRKNYAFFVNCWFVYLRLSRTYPSSTEPDDLGVAGGDRAEEDIRVMWPVRTPILQKLFLPARERVATQIFEGTRFDSVIVYLFYL